ncbi:uncharacterized protein LOC141678731 [Apium graveolens]|uniref:uncharacterized protein LOC141678731 n=1 Tax=Apium graveolens TaxID=4045 RepID=UPI003D7AAEF4
MASSSRQQKGDKQTKEILSREERLQLFMNNFAHRAYLEEEEDDDHVSPDGSRTMTFRDIASLQLDLYETDGFDVQDYSKVTDASMILPLYDPAANITECGDHLPDIVECAEKAILEYNGAQGKNFGNVNVIKTNVEPVCPYRYYITFEAHDATEGITETFEAKVDIHIPITDRTIRFVRIRQPPRFYCPEN